MKHISSTSFQAWRTPDALFQGLNEELGPFDLDVAADAQNCKVYSFFDEDSNALSDGAKWHGTIVWCNPPYADIRPWIDKAEVEVAAGHCERVVMLVPASVGVAWFTYAARKHAVDFFDERIRFALPPIHEVPEELRAKLFTKKGKPKTSPGGGNALIIVGTAPVEGARPVFRSARTGRLLL